MHAYHADLAIQTARKYAEMNMMAEVQIVRMGEAVFNVDGTVTAVEGDVVYEGKARVYSVQGPITMGIGDEPTYFSSTFVSVPIAALPMVNDLVWVMTDADPLMAGRPFRVLDVQAGGQFPAVRRMSVQGIQMSPEWSDGTVIPREWIP